MRFAAAVVRSLSLGTVALACGVALAQGYPTKPVTVIVPWPPGGPSDIAARPLGKGLTELLGKPFVIENRGGASGNIGSTVVAQSAPDGYQLLVTSASPIVINPSLYKNMPFNPQKDLAPITNLLRVPLVLAVNPSLPVKNLKELIEYIKKQGGKFQYASAGSGTPQHLTAELFRTAAKLDIIHIPYKGAAPAITDALGGHVPMLFDSTVAIVPHLKAGKLRPIAISSTKRSPLLPDVPTFAEAGLPGVEAYAWCGFFAPVSPAISGHTSRPSIFLSGNFAPVRAAIVGSMSIVIRKVSHVVPVGIFPGQRMMHGTRTPPSQLVPLPSRNGPALPACSP